MKHGMNSTMVIHITMDLWVNLQFKELRIIENLFGPDFLKWFPKKFQIIQSTRI